MIETRGRSLDIASLIMSKGASRNCRSANNPTETSRSPTAFAGGQLCSRHNSKDGARISTSRRLSGSPEIDSCDRQSVYWSGWQRPLLSLCRCSALGLALGRPLPSSRPYPDDPFSAGDTRGVLARSNSPGSAGQSAAWPESAWRWSGALPLGRVSFRSIGSVHPGE